MSKMTPREALNRQKENVAKLRQHEFVEYVQDFKLLEALVEKSEPKLVVYETVFGVKVPTCPNCHNGILEQDAFNTQIFYSGKYCSHCGQALNWEKEGK